MHVIENFESGRVGPKPHHMARTIIALAVALGLCTATACSSAAPTGGAWIPPDAPATSATAATATPDASPGTSASASASAGASASPRRSATGIVNSKIPVRAAFYYPWYPENFKAPSGKYMPSAGYYNGDDRAVVARQIKDMQYGQLQAGIASWWGKGKREDNRLPLLMAEAAKLDFSWSIYYEAESLGDPSSAQISADLNYLRRYADLPAWLHIGGRPAVFVYADGNDACGMVTRWANANKSAGYYVVLKVFGGYRDCAGQPQGWHQYAPGGHLDVQAGYSASVSPGFYRYDAASPMLPRDPARFRQDVATVAASRAPFQLVTTYNEWGEGTSVESTTDWPSASGHGVYVDILHDVFGAYPR